MSEQYLGEIRLFANGYAPRGWALCEGQILSIQQNAALFSLLGTTYGGNGQTTFALPDLRGRVPIHFNSNHPLGASQGEAAHTLISTEIPMHTHLAQGSSAAASDISPQNNVWATQSNLYGPASSLALMNPESIAATGGSQPHNNMQPYLSVNFCIALVGIYPSRN
ncbi:phage tail protein [Tumebacillus sp. ITR2]|uniref:Phage tail protein n=1 Tax=Tumebacillus amylolyticus TaxID=2801339 RepID=A0ABS1J8G0_9BACL|nr:tail fiber protein [Tumebacillus amylolyticus]MBL0386544.1 phage tail protein [Tumebacillus amylolyticus]